jgi:hypothetical protein
MGVKDQTTPPSEWCNWWDTPIQMLNDHIGYGWPGDGLTAAVDDPNPWFWHWCPAGANGNGRWEAQATTEHTLVSREPLHMEPSRLWPCCGTHGFVRGGEWVSA